MSFTFTLFIYSAISLAQNRSDIHVTVWARDPDAVRTLYQGPQYSIIDRESEEQEWKREGYLPPRERNALFYRIHLSKAVAKYPEMEKDILVIGAHFGTIKQLRKRFPKLSVQQLQSLMDAVREQ